MIWLNVRCWVTSSAAVLAARLAVVIATVVLGTAVVSTLPLLAGW